MTNAAQYIEKYKELEKVVRTTYGLKEADSISYALTSKAKFRNDEANIRYCQDVRNLLQHKEKLGDAYPVEPTDAMLRFIEALIARVKNRKKCSDIMIPYKNIYWQPLTGRVKDTMVQMRNQTFTHIPILENGIVIGAFDENSIFSYLADEEIIEISDELTFADIRKYIGTADREMESFLFFRADNYADDLEDRFNEAMQTHTRIGMVFLTASGKKNEKLQGIITPWDVIAAR